jgi:hypothetical protein
MISLVYALFLVHSTLYSRLFTAPRLSTLSAQHTVARQIQMVYHTRNVGEPFSVSPVGFPRGDTAPSWVRGPPRDELDGYLTPGRLRVWSYKRWPELTRTNQNPHSLSSHLIQPLLFTTPPPPHLTKQPCSSPPSSLSSLLPSLPRPPSSVSPLPSASLALWRSA